jgi:hypothetical protein
MKNIESCSHGAAGNIWCPNKVNKTLKTALGLVVIFVKNPTWWQPHVAGELSFRGTLRIVGCQNSRVLSMSPPTRQLLLDQ